jgi:hypothetical protein
VVQKVNPDGSLKLFVMSDKGHAPVSAATQGVGVGQWNWPARV